VDQQPDEDRLRVRCVCGWEATGNIESTVALAIDHGQRVHNMTATREAVLATAEWLDRPARAADRP
jgi:hypothetical protein